MQNARRAARRIIASLTISLLLGGLSTQTAAAQGSPRVTGPVYVAVEVPLPPHDPTPQPINGGGGGDGSYRPVYDGGGGGGGGGSISVAYVIGGAILLGGVSLAYRARARR